jgi:hypothetical protein
VSDLMAYAQGSPLLLAALVIVGAVLATVERVFALSGPVTKLAAWWSGRELARLRREALLRAERRRIELEERSAREAELAEENTWLRAQLARARAGQPTELPDPTTPIPGRSRNPARVPTPRR